MKVIRAMQKKLISALAIAMLGMVTVALASTSPTDQAPAQKINHYIGSGKCKNCHSTAENGNQFDCWTKSKHAEAFKTLATEAAKTAGATKGVTEPQKDDKCVKCHTTGFGLAEDQFKKGFDRTAGVQCETCHGPGEAHMAARMAGGASPDPKVRISIPDGEIAMNANPKFCQTCHNPESPSYKPFCYHERLEKIAHYDPRGTRKPTLPLKECPCDATCECKKGACKDLPQKK